MHEETPKMRVFDTGATRDLDTTKLDYEGFMTPIVLKAYAEYLNKHRVQRDGKLRESDNWQKMFGDKHFDVCMKSTFRHFMDMWLYHRGFEASESIDDALAAIIFNVSAYWFKILKDRETLAKAMKNPGVVDVMKLQESLQTQTATYKLPPGTTIT